MSSLGGYDVNFLVAVEYIEDVLGGIKRFGEAMLVCNHVLAFGVSVFGV